MAIAAETETTRKGPPLILQLAVFLLLTAAAIGGGWMTGQILNGENAEARGNQPRNAEQHQDEGSSDAAVEKLRIFPLATITTNLADPQEIWIRLELALAFNDKPDPEVAELVHQDLLAYLRTVKARQIDGASGFQHLRSDLDERARIRSGGRVKQVLIRTMLFE